MAHTTQEINNRSARHHYFVLETFEVGIMLKGTEVKSVRAGKLVLSEAFVQVRKNELWLVNAYIEEYTQGNIYNHLPRRERKLLAHRTEIRKLDEATGMKGHTLIPLKAYFKGSVLKLEVGVCKGKEARDKRQDKAKQEAKRDIARALKDANRPH
ncbi:MAG TPA: SsrA-binding protein SmpB [Fibrobacteria bacterium]|nr:SsrA-binding protein SmpB [Fibrobacteria bacterium]